MRLHYKAGVAVTALCLSPSLISSSEGLGIAITEVASQGTGEDHCNGEDWVEFQNILDTTIDLTGWKVYDDDGPDDANAWTIPEGYGIDPGAYLVVCQNQDFLFGIGFNDSVTIADPDGVVVDAVSLPEEGFVGGAETDMYTYALFENDEFKYTTTPTPGEANVLTEILSLMEQYQKDNEAREAFFDMDGDFGKVVDIDITIGEEELNIITEHFNWKEYVAFDGFTVTTAGDDSATVIASSGTGRIRPKGQSSLNVIACQGFSTTPFMIKFDAPFMGLDSFYLRNHAFDPSYMKDHAAMKILEAFGLPSMRTRPARLFMNGEYIGFYLIMEPPDSGQFMQKSFGDFDPDTTAIYKLKTAIDMCPYDQEFVKPILTAIDPEFDLEGPPPDIYYCDAGRLKDDPPIGGDPVSCDAYMRLEVGRGMLDLARGWYTEFNQDCGRIMVEKDKIGRKFGPKSTEEPMIEFLNQYFYNWEEVSDLSTVVDIDDWLKNFAFMAVMLHFDSPLDNINNWYLATMNGGKGDWRIVQFDHNGIMKSFETKNNAECYPKIAFLPILQPTAGPIEQGNIVVSRILNSEDNMEKYLGYVSDLVDILTTEDGVISDLYDYGNAIKEYVMEDSLNSLTLEQYEYQVLGDDIENYFLADSSAFLKFTQFRVQQVKEQLEAIETGTLPRDGKYDPSETCPDWRNTGTDVPWYPSTPSEDCAIQECMSMVAYHCYDIGCTPEGKFLDSGLVSCAELDLSPKCDSCYPHSLCGSATDVDMSGTFVPDSEMCRDALTAEPDCEIAGGCFSHLLGMCAFDGTFLSVECKVRAPVCRSCFPYSRCGSGPAADDLNGTATVSEDVVDTTAEQDANGDNLTGAFTPNEDTCGTGFESCVEAGPCFDHTMGMCAEDGTFTNPMCDEAVACKSCYPNSRCGTHGSIEDGSGVFTPDDNTCGAEFEACADAATCFDHNVGLCAEDGSFSSTVCGQAEACAPCFPNSRCGSVAVTVEDEPTNSDTTAEDEGEEPEQKEEAPSLETESTSMADDESTGVCAFFPMVSIIAVAIFNLWMMAVFIV